MSGRALDADVSSQAYYWTYRVHAQTLAAGTERDWSGMKLWYVGTNDDVCHQAGRRLVGPPGVTPGLWDPRLA